MPDNPPHNALRAAIARSIAAGNPPIVNMPGVPVTANGRTIGYIVRGDRGSHYVQCKRVPAGACVNLGPRY